MRKEHDAAYWRARAEEARTIADGMRDPEAKTTMEGIVAAYELLARLAEDAKQREDQTGRLEPKEPDV